MSNAQTTYSGDAHCRLPGGIVPSAGATADDNRDEQRHDDDQRSVMSSTGPSTGLRSSAPFVEQLNPETEDATQLRPGSPTVDHHSAFEDIDASTAFLRTLAGMNDDEVLASILRQRHRADVHRDVARVDLDWQDVVKSSLELQPVMTPDDAETLPRRQRTHEGGNENEALQEKWRRVRSGEQQGSPTVSRLRLRAPLSTINNTSSSTAAARTTLQIHTAAAAALSHENKGAVVVESNERITDGVDEMLIASLAPPAALSPLARQPCDRVEPSPDVRRSKRVAMLAAMVRKRAAAAVRAAVKAVPVARLRRQSVIMRGNGGGEGRA